MNSVDDDKKVVENKTETKETSKPEEKKEA